MANSQPQQASLYWGDITRHPDNEVLIKNKIHLEEITQQGRIDCYKEIEWFNRRKIKKSSSSPWRKKSGYPVIGDVNCTQKNAKCPLLVLKLQRSDIYKGVIIYLVYI